MKKLGYLGCVGVFLALIIGNPSDLYAAKHRNGNLAKQEVIKLADENYLIITEIREIEKRLLRVQSLPVKTKCLYSKRLPTLIKNYEKVLYEISDQNASPIFYFLIHNLASRQGMFDPSWVKELKNENKLLVKRLTEMRKVRRMIEICF